MKIPNKAAAIVILITLVVTGLTIAWHSSFGESLRIDQLIEEKENSPELSMQLLELRMQIEFLENSLDSTRSSGMGADDPTFSLALSNQYGNDQLELMQMYQQYEQRERWLIMDQLTDSELKLVKKHRSDFREVADAVLRSRAEGN